MLHSDEKSSKCLTFPWGWGKLKSPKTTGYSGKKPENVPETAEKPEERRGAYAGNNHSPQLPCLDGNI